MDKEGGHGGVELCGDVLHPFASSCDRQEANYSGVALERFRCESIQLGVVDEI